MLLGLNSRAGIEKPLLWNGKYFTVIWLCHLDSLSVDRTGVFQLSPCPCCGSVSATLQVTMGTRDVPGAETSPAFIVFYSTFLQITDPALLVTCQSLLFFLSVLSSLMAALNLDSFPTSQLEFLGVPTPHASLNSHAFWTTWELFPICPSLSWFSSKFGHFWRSRDGFY